MCIFELWFSQGICPTVGLLGHMVETANKHMKRCSTRPLLEKCKIITTMRYHLTPARIATAKTSTNNKCWRGCGEKGTLLHCWWECKLIWPLWRTVWRFLIKLGFHLSLGTEGSSARASQRIGWASNAVHGSVGQVHKEQKLIQVRERRVRKLLSREASGGPGGVAEWIPATLLWAVPG